MHRLRRVAKLHRWQLCAEALDHQHADATSAALNQVLHDEAKDWPARVQQFGDEAWQLSKQVLESAQKAAHELAEPPRNARLGKIARMVDVWPRLGRRATGLPLDPATAPPASSPISSGGMDALHKIYGQDTNFAAKP